MQCSAISNLQLKIALQCGQLANAITVMSSILADNDSIERICFSGEIVRKAFIFQMIYHQFFYVYYFDYFSQITHAESIFERNSDQQLQFEFERVLGALISSSRIVDTSLDVMLADLTQSEECQQHLMIDSDQKAVRHSKWNKLKPS